jgi:hypothetical protein
MARPQPPSQTRRPVARLRRAAAGHLDPALPPRRPQALLAHLNHHDHDEGLLTGPAAGRPVVAVRVRASVGRPGASAHAEYRRRRAPTAPPGPTACPGGPASCRPSA